ncbi:MAG: tetratricopeptide repeat protein, partial [Bacteroidota bacterium]
MIRSPYLLLVFLSIALLGCSTSKKIKDGATAYQQKQYAVAIDKLTEEIKGLEGGEEYARLAYLLGDSYKRLNDSPNSLNWFIEAAKNDYGADAYWEMAYALKKQERYADAVLSFRRLAKLTDRQDLIREEIQKCRKAQEWSQLAAGETYILEPIALNSDASDYAPTLRGDQLVFSSDRYLDSNDDTYNWTGNAFSDLYVSDIDVYGAIPMKGPNTRHNEGTATFTQEGDIMYFTRCYSEVGDEYCQIYRSELRGGAWSLGDPAFQMKPRVNYSEPVLIENDSVLIFISDDPTGVGGSDLYYSFMLDDGTWDIPELMPAYLNSIGDERFPTWDGESLYYSSDHFPGLGGLDIFVKSGTEDVK